MHVRLSSLRSVVNAFRGVPANLQRLLSRNGTETVPYMSRRLPAARLGLIMLAFRVANCDVRDRKRESMPRPGVSDQPKLETTPVRLATGDALVVVDVQNDFLPGGALAVPAADRILPVLNDYLQLFANLRLPIFATRDWHPHDHCSFREQGGPWPLHCVADSAGAAFSKTLELPASTIVISKGTDARREAYSGFQGTDMIERLRAAGVRRVFVGGLATEYCVRATALDALSAGLSVIVLADAIGALEAKPGDAERAEQEMVDRGAALIRRKEIA